MVATRPNAATRLGKPLRAAGPHLQRGVDQRQREHRMRHHGSGDAAGDLRGDIAQRIARRQFALQAQRPATPPD